MDTLTGVGVIDKTAAILEALSVSPLGLTELANETGIAKPTVHRLCQALEQHGLVARNGDLRILGERLIELASSVPSTRSRLIAAAHDALEQLRDETGESVQLYVREGSARRCIAGLESVHGLRTIVEVGALLPLDAGSAGAVLSNQIERRGWVESVEERERGVASVSAPVMINGSVVAAISLSGPIDRVTRAPGRKFGRAVAAAGASVSNSLT